MESKLDEAWCYMVLRKVRWPNGIVCPYCGEKRVTTHTKATRTPRRRYLCLICRKTFSDLTGTPFARTNLSLRTWIICFDLLARELKTSELAKRLGVKWDTTAYMLRRLAMSLEHQALVKRLYQAAREGRINIQKVKNLLLLALACALAALVFFACSAETRHKILTTVFDGVDSPPPPTHRLRRDLLQEIEDLKRKLAQAEREKTAAQQAAKAGKGTEAAPPIEKAKSWEEASKLLPKDKAGSVDWVQALKDSAIRPRPGVGSDAAEQASLDMDVELSSSANKLFHVTYPHSAHTQWLACGNCHPAIFPLRQAKPTVVTMAKIKAGEYCGVCHGKVAFSVDKECYRCHTSSQPAVEWHSPEPQKPIEKAQKWEEAVKLLPVTQGTPDWAKALSEGVIVPKPGIDPKAEDQPALPLDVELIPATGEMFKVIFAHKAHTEWLQCPNCHNGIFQMAKGADPMTMDKINSGQYCGVCHGKVAFAPTACARCHPAMGGGK